MKEHPILFSAPMVRAIIDGHKTQTRRVVKLTDSGRVKEIGSPRNWHLGDPEAVKASPYGQPGDRLWVREAWQYSDWTDDGYPYIGYRVDGSRSLREKDIPEDWSERLMDIWAQLSDGENFKIDNRAADRKWRSPRFMPRWASRITLEVTGVRVERLQEISEADAKAEGCEPRLSGTWWQGYKDLGEKHGLIHQQAPGEEPPDWMIEPHKMVPTPWLDRSAKQAYEILWDQINAKRAPWAANPWVWVIEFKRVAP